MPLLDPLTDTLASDTAIRLFQTLQSKLGKVPNMYRTLGHAPQVLQSVGVIARLQVFTRLSQAFCAPNRV